MTNTEPTLAELARLYKDGNSINTIAKRFGWYYDKARRRLKKADVRFRTAPQGVHLAKGNPDPLLTTDLLSAVEGLLLSDGSIERGNYGSRLSLGQTESREGWVEEVRQRLKSLGVQSSTSRSPGGVAVIRGAEYHRNPAVTLRSLRYPFLTEQHRRWYSEGKKVPRDLVLTPLSLAYWYLGDGGTGSRGYQARFCTDSFPEEDVWFLVERLRLDFSIRATRTPRNRVLVADAQSRKILVGLVEPYTPICFRYKLDLKTEDGRQSISEHERGQILAAREAGASYGKLVKEFGRSKTRIAEICNAAGLGGAMSKPGPRRTIRMQDDRVVDHVTGKRMKASKYIKGFVEGLH